MLVLFVLLNLPSSSIQSCTINKFYKGKLSTIPYCNLTNRPRWCYPKSVSHCTATVLSLKHFPFLRNFDRWEHGFSAEVENYKDLNTGKESIRLQDAKAKQIVCMEWVEADKRYESNKEIEFIPIYHLESRKDCADRHKLLRMDLDTRHTRKACLQMADKMFLTNDRKLSKPRNYYGTSGKANPAPCKDWRISNEFLEGWFILLLCTVCLLLFLAISVKKGVIMPFCGNPGKERDDAAAAGCMPAWWYQEAAGFDVQYNDDFYKREYQRQLQRFKLERQQRTMAAASAPVEQRRIRASAAVDQTPLAPSAPVDQRPLDQRSLNRASIDLPPGNNVLVPNINQALPSPMSLPDYQVAMRMQVPPPMDELEEPPPTYNEALRISKA